MATKIAVANIKGGIGKTSTILNLADQLMKRNYRVLMVDMDPQRNTTAVYRAKTQDVPTMYDVFFADYQAKDCIQHTEYGDIIPNDEALVNADSQVRPGPGMYKILKKVLQPVEALYDFILFDTPPHAGVLLGNTLMCCEYVIIPIEFDLFAVQGLADLNRYLSEYREDNPDLKVLGILKIKYKPRQNLTKGLEENSLPEYAKQMGTTVFRTAIRESVRLKEAFTVRKRLSEFAPNSTVAEDYANFTKEVLKKVRK